MASFTISSFNRSELLPIIPDPRLDSNDLVEFNKMNRELYNRTCSLWVETHHEFTIALNKLDFFVSNIQKFKDKGEYSKHVETGKKICEFLVRFKKTVADLAPPPREPGGLISVSADALDEVQQRRSKAVERLEGMTNSLYIAYSVALEQAAKAGGFNEDDRLGSTSEVPGESSSSNGTSWIVIGSPGTEMSSPSTSTSLSTGEKSGTGDPQSPSSTSSFSPFVISSLFSPIKNLFIATQTFPSEPFSPKTPSTTSTTSSSTASTISSTTSTRSSTTPTMSSSRSLYSLPPSSTRSSTTPTMSSSRSLSSLSPFLNGEKTV